MYAMRRNAAEECPAVQGAADPDPRASEIERAQKVDKLVQEALGATASARRLKFSAEVSFLQRCLEMLAVP